MPITEIGADVKFKTLYRRDFRIVQSIDGWEWSHLNYNKGTPVAGTCENFWEAIEAVDAWYERETA